MKVAIGAVAIGGHYPQLAARMLQRFEAVCPGYDVRLWVNSLPLGAPKRVVEDAYHYTAYCAKPWALSELAQGDTDIAILIDAAFYPVRDIQPLVNYIAETGYYLCKNEFKVGQWCSDRAMKHFQATRDELMEIEEASSYCVGLDVRRGACRQLITEWCKAADARGVFEGKHTAGKEGRNPGFVSDDPRVMGHRHDQTALSILAHRLGMHELVPRPRFTGYALREWNVLAPTEETALVNWGKLDVQF